MVDLTVYRSALKLCPKIISMLCEIRALSLFSWLANHRQRFISMVCRLLSAVGGLRSVDFGSISLFYPRRPLFVDELLAVFLENGAFQRYLQHLIHVLHQYNLNIIQD